MLLKQKTIIACIFLVIFFILPQNAKADALGGIKDFFIDTTYDEQGREKVSALLHRLTEDAYFYVEQDWYNNLTEGQKTKVATNLAMLTGEFSDVIYPQLTQKYGSEWNPGIDSDKHITILFHKMHNTAAGYFKSSDELSPLQNNTSNEREMVYLNSTYLLDDIIKSYLAHEFTHLITYNQKNKLNRKEEHIWLNESRAEYAPTLLGYDNDYPNSNLQKRIDLFLSYPSNSLTVWDGGKSDYGTITAFTNYFVGHYGEEILSSALQNSKTGVESIEQALSDAYIEKDFWQIFSDWVIANFINDCRKNNKHCYNNGNLDAIKINPSLIFLPPNQKTNFSLTNNTKFYSANWYRIIGGADNLEVIFSGDKEADFKVPYALCRESYDCAIDFLEFNQENEATLIFDDFIDNYTSLTLMPFVISEIQKSNENILFDFTIKVSAYSNAPSITKQELINSLRIQIADIVEQIAVLQQQLAAISREEGSCASLTQNMYLGVRGFQVECLQKFLKEQGTEIYKEAYVTGYFGPLTQLAVIKFQNKYASEILHPLGITKATGYVGAATRSQINQF